MAETADTPEPEPARHVVRIVVNDGGKPVPGYALRAFADAQKIFDSPEWKRAAEHCNEVAAALAAAVAPLQDKVASLAVVAAPLQERMASLASQVSRIPLGVAVDYEPMFVYPPPPTRHEVAIGNLAQQVRELREENVELRRRVVQIDHRTERLAAWLDPDTPPPEPTSD